MLAATGVSSGLIGEEAERVVVAVIALTMIMSPMWLELARRLHALRAAPSQGLGMLLARLLRDEARILRLRSGRIVQGGSQLAASLGGGLDRVLPRRRDAAVGPPAAEPARAVETDRTPPSGP